jgi:hypothetical protein
MINLEKLGKEFDNAMSGLTDEQFKEWGDKNMESKMTDITEGGKYYELQKEDLCIGFKYQFRRAEYEEWEEAEIKSGTQIDDIFCFYPFNDDRIYELRVKRLCHEDILAEGWEWDHRFSGDNKGRFYEDVIVITRKIQLRELYSGVRSLTATT